MQSVELKLKQASAVLGVAPKDLQNLVQFKVLRQRGISLCPPVFLADVVKELDQVFEGTSELPSTDGVSSAGIGS
jgi:hypothetical protein